MRPCCSHATAAGDALHERRRAAHTAPCQMRSLTVDAIARRAVERRGQLAVAWRRTAGRCAGSVVRSPPPYPACAHRAAEAAIPGRARGGRAGDRTRCTMQIGEHDTTAHDREEDRGRVRSLPLGDGTSRHQLRRCRLERIEQAELLRHDAEQRDDLSRQQAERTQPAASQTSPTRSSRPASCARASDGFARLAEEDHAEELHHDVGGQRGGQRDHRRAERQQHVHERARHLVREQERLQQQPFRYEAVERRQPRDRERADQREPRDPRHAVDQAAELARGCARPSRAAPRRCRGTAGSS